MYPYISLSDQHVCVLVHSALNLTSFHVHCHSDFKILYQVILNKTHFDIVIYGEWEKMETAELGK